ncbi:GntR family transcriptional regulator [Streptomyces sp. NPDC093984]|uniref:GntR family transcriptional regulator n=1 Tax=Streptomyces sp. NPDC093984 TaxID=3366052 RepID=UPI003828947C
MSDSRRLSPQQVADVLRERIRNGELKTGGRLPSQQKLAEELRVTRTVVRDAQRVLQEDGLLSMNGRGSTARVAEPAVSREEPQPALALVGLPHRLEAAFQASHVQIDAVCLTAETLMRSMDAPLRLVASHRAEPRSVEARIILPAKEHRLFYPAPLGGWGADEDADAAVHKRSEEQHVSQVNVLWRQFDRLRVQYKIDARVRFRVVRNTPYHKIYLLNETEVLFAHYHIAARTEEIDGAATPLRDTPGTRSLLFSFDARNGDRDMSFVDDSRKWFNSLWDSLEPDLKVPLVAS